MKRHKSKNRGSKNGRAIDIEVVKGILRDLEKGSTVKQILQVYPVSKNVVYRLRNKEHYIFKEAKDD